MAQAPELSVIVPAYNEARRLPRALRRIAEYFAGVGCDLELIVVDDGSADETTRVAREALAGLERAEVISFERNRGKGAAVRAGMLQARGDQMLFSDADLSTPIEEESRLRAALRAGADVAIGSRGLPDANITLAQGALRQSAGRSFNRVLRLLGLTDLHDTQCGFKAFTRDATRQLFSRSRIDGFLFDVEILYLARKAGMRVVELPVEWHNDPDSRVHVVRHFPRIASELVRIRLGF